MIRKTSRPLAAALALPLLLAAAPASAASSATLKPFDHAAKDPGFVRFRARLMQIVERRDLAALRRLLHPGVRMSLGERPGVATALQVMRLQPKRWAILARLLRKGGGWKTFEQDGRKQRMFYAPYTYFAELLGADGYNTVTIAGTRVRVRARPSLDAPVLAKLSHKVVKTLDENGEASLDHWVKIRLPDGRAGYVHDRYVVSPIDYRVGFEKYKGRWTLRVFLAGD